MTKHVRIAGSFLVVVAAYGVYSVAAVPFIEPEDSATATEEVTAEEREQALANVAQQRTDLLRWFKEGDWELTSPKILETDQGKLLLKEYLPDKDDLHVVTLKPCTMIFLPEGTFENEQERLRRAVIMRSPDGARLRFAEPIDLRKGEVGSKIDGGELLGKVTIRSDQRSPGPEDDLLLLTERVTMANDVVTTPHMVEFFQGPNQGRGRDMRLVLTTAAEKQAKPSLPAAKSFELARDVYMRMESTDGDILMGGPKADADPTPDAATKPKPPAEITCRGKFHFDMLSYVATFHDHVDVVRLNAVGPSDTLTCEKLSLHFEPDPTAAPASGPNGKSAVPRLRPKLIVADGNPVILDSPSNGVQARGRRLEYDVQTRSGKLIDGEEAMLRQNDPVSHQVREIHAREMEFESDPTSPSGPPRKVDARGKGWLRGSPPDDPAHQIYVRWSSRLTFYPYQGSQVLSIRGQAHVQSSDTGALDADEIHVWLQKSAAGGPKSSLTVGGPGGGFVPEKMTAIGNVKPDMPQLQGLVGRLSVWFEKEPPPVVAAAPADTTAAPPPPPAPEPEKPAERGPPDQRWHVSGDLVKAQVMLRNSGKAEITQMTLDGHARGAELPMPIRPGQNLPQKPEQLLEITGEQFHLVQPTPQDATVRIIGRPARVSARGMTLKGGSEKDAGAIHLHRTTNRLWVPGPGELELPIEEDMQGHKLGQPQTLKVVWPGRLDFDGLEAHFQKTQKKQPDVVAFNEESLLKTPDLRVVFNEPVRFDGSRGAARPQIERLLCRQGVNLDHRQRQAGKWTAWERMTARDLSYRYSTGDMEADGPGRITRTWLDSGNSSFAVPSGPAKKPSPESTSKSPRLVYLNASFDDKLTGNQRQETVTLHRRVKSVYGPVLKWDSWIDPNHPERFGNEGFVIECDKLKLDQTGKTATGEPTMELAGEGNTWLYGADFSARCWNVHYASAKDMLTLSGDGRAPASFYRNQTAGTTPLEFSAARILYNLKTQKLNVENFELLDMTNLPTQKPAAKPAVR
ncbi:MAG TPA: hypothetical protein VFI31_15330 [Pirellulales bacterium]|nr:hypothetical protein [Pirellulales bacterium]